MRCVECGREIESSRYGPSRRMYCSSRCKKAAFNRANPRAMTPRKRTANQRRRSALARLNRAALGVQAGLRRWTAGPCSICGRLFVSPQDSTTCSSVCATRRDKRRWRRKNGSDNTRKRAQRFGVEYQRIEPRSIYARDNWTCGLCHEPIDRATVYPDLGSPSIDHVVPMSLGGAHVKSNVQASHLGCNIEKGNNVEKLTWGWPTRAQK